MKKIIITLLALVTAGGVASADRSHGNHQAPTVRDHRSGGVSVEPARSHENHYQDRGYQNRGYQNRGYQDHGYQGRASNQSRWHAGVRFTTPSVRVVRRPIYVQRPTIGYRYYNYYQRPSVIVEDYPARDGYFWVAGQWQWNGAEWIWQAGHYEPDPNYMSPYYDANGNYIDPTNGAPYDTDTYYNGGY